MYGDDWKSGKGENKQAKSVAEGMDSLIKASAISIAQSGAFEGVSRLLDIGGGSGAYAVAITEAVENLEAIVLDLPTMCHQAKKFIRRRRAERVSTYCADFFHDDWPAECDGFLFSNVLHDWPIKEVKKLLKKARMFLPTKIAKGSIFIHEALLDKNRNGPQMVAIFNLQMQMGFGGSQFTKIELSDLLEDAGFTKPRVVAKFGYYTLLQAKTI